MQAGADAFVLNPAGEGAADPPVGRRPLGDARRMGGAGRDPEAAAVREAEEETGLMVGVRRGGSVHHAVHCGVAGGELRPSDESPEVAFRRPEGVTAWHADHGERVAEAVAIVGGRG